ncbi:MAG: cytochrome c [Chloroflexi bacterium]|nr:cytochrome c [Chloroflexota bacterium]
MRFLILLIGMATMLVACGGSEPEPTPTPALTQEEKLGQQVFARECGACHSLAAETVIVGPSLHGISNRASERVSGQDANTYLLTAVLNPDAYLVDGYENLMPATFGKSLTGEELDAVIAFLMVQREE